MNQNAAMAKMRELIVNHGDDKPMIVSEMRKAVSDDAVIAEIVIGLGIEQCYAALRHSARETSWRTATGEPTVIAGMHNSMSAYDFPLPGGKRLGDATAADLEEAIKTYSEQARGHLRNVRWLSYVRKALGKNKTVRQGVPIETLVKLQQKADKETGLET